MTIAVGFVCTDGVVVAADTKELYGDAHTFVHKLEIVDSNLCSGALAGAGYGHVLDFITPKIKELFENEDYKTVDGCEKALSGLMAAIYSSKSMKAFPKDRATDILTSFMVALRPKGSNEKPGLFLVNSSLVTRIRDGARAVGHSTMQQMCDEIGRLHPSIQKAKAAALYVVYETKQRTNEVGGLTHIYGLGDDGAVYLDRTWDQPERETLLANLRNLHHFMVMSISNPDLQPWEFSNAMKEVGFTSRRIRGSFRRIEGKYQQWRKEQDDEFLKAISIKP